MANKIDTRINARFLPMIAPMVCKEPTRYYLNGVYIEPHPNLPGVLAVATNGHILGVAYDKDGCADTGRIFPLSRDLLTNIKKHASQARFDGETVQLFREQATGATTKPGPEKRLFIGLSEQIDGTFPDWRRVVPKDSTAPTGNISFNPDYLKAVSRACGNGTVTFRTTDASSPAILRFPATPEFFAILMPVRVAESFDQLWPDWFKDKTN